MKIVTKHRDIQSGGLVGRKDFSIKAGAHIMAVLSGLYKNPVDAMVREYLTNMYDAVKALQRVNPKAEIRPGVLSLPTSLNPELKFEDFGIGMSCETVMDVYSQYGNSTKNDSNLEVGGFGLGSKTAFCYNDGSTWTIESRYEGMKHIFMASVGEDGTPFLAHVSSAKSNEHSGVTIRIPILREDIQDCYDAANTYVPYFTLPLTVTGDREVKGAVEYVVKQNEWGVRDGKLEYGDRDWRVIMGNVPYDVDRSDLKLKDPWCAFNQNPFDFFVPVGSVDIVPSRDSLKMTDRTIKVIFAAVASVKRDITGIFTKQIQSAPTYWDALQQYASLDTVNGAREVIRGVQWNGRDVDGEKGVSTTLADLRKIDRSAEVKQYGIESEERSGIVCVQHTTADAKLQLRPKRSWLVIDDHGSKGVARVRSHLYVNLVNHTTGVGGKLRTQRYGHKVGHALVIKTKATPQQLSTLFEGFPVADMMKVSTMIGGHVPNRASGSGVETIYRWNGTQWDARVNIPEDGKKYYVVLEKGTNGRYVWEKYHTTHRHSDETRAYLTFAENLGLNVVVGNIYGVRLDDVSKLDTSIFTKLETAVDERALNIVTTHTQTYVTACTTRVMGASEVLFQWMKSYGVPTINPTFQEAHHAFKEQQKALTNTLCNTVRTRHTLLSAKTQLEIKKLTDPIQVTDVSELANTIRKEYPVLSIMLELITNGWNTGAVLKTNHRTLLDFWNNPQ